MTDIVGVNKIVSPDDKWLGLERCLAASPVFRENFLFLDCGVWARDMIPAAEGSRTPDDGQDQARISYLVCQEDKALLSFEWLPEFSISTSARLDGLLHLCVSDENPDDAADFIAGALKQVLDQAAPPVWLYRAQFVPGKLRPALEKEQMIASRGPTTLPTQYGALHGIIRRYRVKSHGIPRSGAACSDQTLAHLKAVLEKQQASSGPTRKLSLAQRIQRLNSGLPCSGAYSVSLVRRFANTRLDDYMRDFPAELEQLREYLPDSAVTYQQAAVFIYQTMKANSEQEENLKLMRLLAQPLIRRFQTGKTS